VRSFSTSITVPSCSFSQSMGWSAPKLLQPLKHSKDTEDAMALNTQAALEGTSWDRFQIMGFNHQNAGFASVVRFVNAIPITMIP
jgi:hypothetical protein